MVSIVFRVELAAPEHKSDSIHLRAGELHDLGPLLSMLAGKPNIRGDTGLVELGTTERLGDRLELAST